MLIEFFILYCKYGCQNSFFLAGHPEAEQALKKFADFLEKESKEGKMSPQVQKKVLGKLYSLSLQSSYSQMMLTFHSNKQFVLYFCCNRLPMMDT